MDHDSREDQLRGNGDNLFAIADRRPWTHLRLSIYPDGGVARLRVYGEVAVDWARVAPKGRAVDLASITIGGLFLDASDTHYGTRGALIMPDRAKNMGDGWETRRRRGPGHSTGRSFVSARPGRCRRSRSIPTTTRATIPIAPRSTAALRPARRSISSGPRPGRRFCRRRSCRRTSATSFPAHSCRRAAPCRTSACNIYPDGGVSRLRIHGNACARLIRGRGAADARGVLRARAEHRAGSIG